MTKYLYKLPSGRPDILDYKIPEGVLDGAILVREIEESIDLSGKEFDSQMELVDSALSYQELRRREYPKIADQLDAFWHAMHSHAMPRVEPFYSSILAVKQKYPKQG